MSISKAVLIALLVGVLAHTADADEHVSDQPAVVLDEDLWVTFYDLPSRRFRHIHAAILSGDRRSASRDLRVTANYLSVEAERASSALQEPLTDVVERLAAAAENVDRATLQELDALFGRTHWLLAQHYLDFARRSRDERRNRNASLYLWATTHHMERAILWSNVAVSREVRATLEDLRDIAARLQSPASAEQAWSERPVVRAERLLRRVGDQIDRRVLLPAGVPAGG